MMKRCEIKALERTEKIKSSLLWLNEDRQVINMTAINEEHRHEEHAFILFILETILSFMTPDNNVRLIHQNCNLFLIIVATDRSYRGSLWDTNKN